MAQGLLATACNSNCSNSTIKLLILLTNSSLDDFDGARFNTNNNTNDANFTILPYAMHGKINDCIIYMYIFSLFFPKLFHIPVRWVLPIAIYQILEIIIHLS